MFMDVIIKYYYESSSFFFLLCYNLIHKGWDLAERGEIMQTRAELQGSLNQYLSNTRLMLSRSERSVINWAMVDDHQSILELACEHENLIRYFQNEYRIRACGMCFDAV